MPGYPYRAIVINIFFGHKPAIVRGTGKIKRWCLIQTYFLTILVTYRLKDNYPPGNQTFVNRDGYSTAG